MFLSVRQPQVGPGARCLGSDPSSTPCPSEVGPLHQPSPPPGPALHSTPAAPSAAWLCAPFRHRGDNRPAPCHPRHGVKVRGVKRPALDRPHFGFPTSLDAQHLPHPRSAADLTARFAETTETIGRKETATDPTCHPPAHTSLPFPTYWGAHLCTGAQPLSWVTASMHPCARACTRICHPPSYDPSLATTPPCQLWLPVPAPVCSKTPPPSCAYLLCPFPLPTFSPKWPQSAFLQHSPKTVSALVTVTVVPSGGWLSAPSRLPVSCSGHS